jgi:Putative peptidoglycan binding domain
LRWKERAFDGQLAAELRDRLAAAGYDGELAAAFERWAGTENLENRLNGIERIDPVVLAHLRART